MNRFFTRASMAEAASRLDNAGMSAAGSAKAGFLPFADATDLLVPSQVQIRQLASR